MKIVWLNEFFADIFYQRVGWQRNLRPYFESLPGGWYLGIGPLLIMIDKRVSQ